MKRKLQVFVSSTFEDLQEERQAAVEAILKAGHIPAGMELFTAGSDSQLDVIKRWIEESDVYLLILGGRYGSIEPRLGLSYTEVEFDFARSLTKPFFAVVASDRALEEKVKRQGTRVLEKAHPGAQDKFRQKVTSQMCAFFDGPKDVKLAVFETLPQFASSIVVGGWIAASEVTPSEDVARQLTALLDDNQKLRQEVESLRSRVQSAVNETAAYERLRGVLESDTLILPESVTGPVKGQTEPIRASLLRVSLAFVDELARGVESAMGSSERDTFLYYRVASRLASYGLVEEGKVPARVVYHRLKLSKEGVKFLTWARLNDASKRTAQPPGPSSASLERATAKTNGKRVKKKPSGT